MKYKDVNWLLWPEAPSEEVYNDWVKARKSKGHPALTQTAMNKYSKHVAKLVEENACSVEEAFEFAAEAGWRAIMYSFVIGAKSRDIDAYSGHNAIKQCGGQGSTRNTTLYQELNDTGWARSTRDISISEALTDTSWAKDIN